MIDITEVAPGDQVVIQDKAGNVATGTVQGDNLTRCISAFGTEIVIARFSRAGNWRTHPALRIVGHTSPLFPVAS